MRSRYTAVLVSLVVLLILACTVLTTSASAGSPAAAQARAAVTEPSNWAVLFADNFENGSGHWQNGHGEDANARWVVEAVGSGHVFSGQGHITTTLTGQGWPDYRVKFNVMVLEGSVHLNVRVNGCLRYFVGFGQIPVSLSRTSPCTTHTTLSQASAHWETNRWYTVEIAAEGATVKVSVDGAPVIEYTDATPVTSGTVAFEALSNAHVHIDNVEVWGPAELKPLEATWVKTGGPLGGLGYDVRSRPDRPDTMLVSDAYSGVNISVDGGQTWAASNTGVDIRFGPTGDSFAVFSLTVDPHNNDVIWMGTQSRKGIFKSTDGGRTWARKDNGVAGDTGVSFRGFTVDPVSSDIVYAAGEISSSVWAGENRSGKEFDLTKGMVYKTTDGGEHWTQIWSGDNLARYIWIDPGNPEIIYVSTGIFDREAANTDAAAGQAGGVGILKSTDGGRTWRVLNQANGLGNLYVGSLFMHPTNPLSLLAGTGNNSWAANSGVYLTVDGGETWQRTLPVDVSCPQVGAVEFSRSSPNTAYAATGCAIFLSEDGGRTWKQVSDPTRRTWGPSGMWAGFPIDLEVDPREPSRLFANVYGGGNFLSIDGGETWQNASQGYTGAQMIGVSVDPADPATVYAGGRSGPYMSPDGGATWRGLNTFSDGPLTEATVSAVSPDDPQQVLLADSRHGRLFKSSDRGNTWQTVLNYSNELQALPVPNTNQNMQEFTTIVFAPSDPRIVYAGFAFQKCAYTNDPAYCGLSPLVGVHQSTDGGTTWREVTGEGMGLQNVLDLAVHPTLPDTVYAATGGKGVLKSTDGGRTWASVNQGLSIGYARSLAIDSRTPSTVYVGTEGSAVFKSTDDGATWRSSSAGLNPNAAIRAVLVDPIDSSIVWAADYRSGVYRSADTGKTWVQVNKGLSTRAVRDLAISADGRTLYAGTDGEGVFRLDVAPASATAAPPAR